MSPEKNWGQKHAKFV